MPRALRKASEPFGAEGGVEVKRHIELLPVAAVPPEAAVEADADRMIDPLHPMHRDLLARISDATVTDKALTRPTRLAIIFYSAIAAWGLVWLMFESATSLL